MKYFFVSIFVLYNVVPVNSYIGNLRFVTGFKILQGYVSFVAFVVFFRGE